MESTVSGGYTLRLHLSARYRVPFEAVRRCPCLSVGTRANYKEVRVDCERCTTREQFDRYERPAKSNVPDLEQVDNLFFRTAPS